MQSLADRIRAYEQRKARLAETEAKLKDAAKRARSRRLIEIGRLVDKAGLAGLPNETLYGAFLSLRGGLENAKQVEEWEGAGNRALTEEDHRQEESLEPLTLHFPVALEKEAASILRSGGFRFNKVLRHWEGFAEFEDAQQLADEFGGKVHRILAAPSPPPPIKSSPSSPKTAPDAA